MKMLTYAEAQAYYGKWDAQYWLTRVENVPERHSPFFT